MALSWSPALLWGAIAAILLPHAWSREQPVWSTFYTALVSGFSALAIVGILEIAGLRFGIGLDQLCR